MVRLSRSWIRDTPYPKHATALLDQSVTEDLKSFTRELPLTLLKTL